VSSEGGGFAVIWRYHVQPDRVAEFERRYGPAGDWARLFAQAAGYRGTALLKDREETLVYVTVDRWESEAAFLSFRERFGEPYRDLDASCDSLTHRETRVGSFTELG
jgi:hypothetical protein